MSAGTHIKDKEKRLKVQKKRNSCINYAKHSGGCLIRRGLYCYTCKEWKDKSIDNSDTHVKNISVPSI